MERKRFFDPAHRPGNPSVRVNGPEGLAVGKEYVRNTFVGPDFPPISSEFEEYERNFPIRIAEILDDGRIRASYQSYDGKDVEIVYSPQELGIKPFENGGWNQVAWLEDPSLRNPKPQEK
jgi:hypothetical protein